MYYTLIAEYISHSLTFRKQHSTSNRLFLSSLPFFFSLLFTSNHLNSHDALQIYPQRSGNNHLVNFHCVCSPHRKVWKYSNSIRHALTPYGDGTPPPAPAPSACDSTPPQPFPANGNSTTTNGDYEYIVVGSGPGGGPLAARLAIAFSKSSSSKPAREKFCKTKLHCCGYSVQNMTR